jgi:hypothetical protein
MQFLSAIDQIRRAQADLINNREADLLRISLDLSALIKLRIQTSGKNFEGNPFPPYTPFSKRLRREAGYQVGFVDFTQTGQMWASIRPRVLAHTRDQTTVVIESGNARGQEILTKAVPKRGNILTPSSEEIQIIRDANTRRILNRIKALLE